MALAANLIASVCCQVFKINDASCFSTTFGYMKSTRAVTAFTGNTQFFGSRNKLSGIIFCYTQACSVATFAILLKDLSLLGGYLRRWLLKYCHYCTSCSHYRRPMRHWDYSHRRCGYYIGWAGHNGCFQSLRGIFVCLQVQRHHGFWLRYR